LKDLQCVGSQVSIHESPLLSNIKKGKVGNYYKSEVLILVLLPRINKSIGMYWGLGFYIEKTHKSIALRFLVEGGINLLCGFSLGLVVCEFPFEILNCSRWFVLVIGFSDGGSHKRVPLMMNHSTSKGHK